MHSTQNWTQWLTAAILLRLASACCHASQQPRPQPVVQVQQQCPQAQLSHMPQWRVTTTQLSNARGTDLELLLWQRIDSLEFERRQVARNCAPEEIPPPANPSTPPP